MESNVQNQSDIQNIKNHRFQNYIRNSNFDFSQRSPSTGVLTGGTNVVTVGLDGWQAATSSASIYNLNQQVFAVGQSAVPNSPKYYMQLNSNTFIANGNMTFGQCVEGVATLAGKMVTVSFWAQAIFGTINANVIMKQYFGGGGSPSTTNTFYTSSSFAVLAGVWQQYTFSFFVPSIAGKTMGTDNSDGLIFSIQFPYTAGSGQTFNIAQVSLNEGSVALPYRMMGNDISQELFIQERYYEKSYDLGTIPGTATRLGSFYIGTTGDASGFHNFYIKYRNTKRINNASAIVYTISAGVPAEVDAYSTNLGGFTFNGPASVNLAFPSSKGFQALAFSYGAFAPGAVAGQYTCDAEFRNLLS